MTWTELRLRNVKPGSLTDRMNDWAHTLLAVFAVGMLAIALYFLSTGVTHYARWRYSRNPYVPTAIEDMYCAPVDWARDAVPDEYGCLFCHYYLWWYELAMRHRGSVSAAGSAGKVSER